MNIARLCFSLGIISLLAGCIAVPDDAAQYQDPALLPFAIDNGQAQAPFGQAVGDVVINYSRAAPTVGAGGMISDGAMEEFRDHGFRTVVSLLTTPEGVETHAAWAADAGIAYYNLQVTGQGPGDDVLSQFKQIMADPDNYPVMVHCGSASRVGALWARYRIDMGVPVAVAFQEARTIGLTPGMERTVREQHGY